MGVARRSAAPAAVAFAMLAAPGDAIAYRPFDLTDASVAEFRETEIEFGPVQFRRDDSGTTLIAPAVIYNYGFAKDWELVIEGRGEHPLSGDDSRSSLTDDAISLKHVLRDGVLQGKTGASVATEFGVLLP